MSEDGLHPSWTGVSSSGRILLFKVQKFHSAMEARRLFFQSVQDKGADVKHVTGGGGDRQRYLSLLGTEFRKKPSSSVEMHPTVVEFSLHDLLEFKGTSQTLGAFKQQPEPARKRPNYDNSRRAMFANPQVRVKKLMLCLTIFSLSSIFRSNVGLILFDKSIVPPLWLVVTEGKLTMEQTLFESRTWRKQCRCHRFPCCFSRLQRKEEDVLSFTRVFWSMEKPTQDAYAMTPAFLNLMGLDGFVVILGKFGALMHDVSIWLSP